MTLRLDPARELRHFEDAANVVRRVTPQDPVSPDEIEHGLASNPDSLLLVAYLDDELVGSAFAAGSSVADAAYTMARVVPELRGRGVGRALYQALSRQARTLDRNAVWGRVREEDEASLAVVLRWGFDRVGYECDVVLDLASAEPAETLPDGVEVVSLAERPDLERAAYEVESEAVLDMPAAGPITPWAFERWRAAYLEGPSALPQGCYVALAEGEVVGIAGLTALGADPGSAEHLLTGVRRAWRGRGIATALKRAQIEWARGAGLERLVTSNDETNVPMRGINARLGYEPRPGAIVVRGPLAPA